MNVSDAVRQRRSVRDFRPDPVPKALLAEVLDAARWAPSGSNIQAWRIVAVTGAARDAIVEMTRSAVSAPGFGKSADPFPIYPPELWEPLRTRRYTLAEDMYRALGIPREDKPARLRHVARNFEFFGAPVGLFFVIDQRVAHGQWAHLGMLIQSVALLLEELGEPLMTSTLLLPGDEFPMTDASEIHVRLGKTVEIVRDGGNCGLEPTTVVDLSGEAPVVVRDICASAPSAT
mgnify:CR=1 FL=1